ncbi:MAG: ABC transporter permease [Planctomycetes bacterium]|nr:ABC transporter permease [Planctomycetota bacterium]
MMKASTHTEIYRPYRGQLKTRPAVERILAWSGIRLGFRRKLPALLLFTPSAIAALVGCVSVHLMFTVRELAEEAPSGQGKMISQAMEGLLGDVSENIFRFLQVEQFFALLTLAWYGSRLIAEDRRLSANLLYFARPVTPLRYIGGKLLTAFAFGALTLLVPALMICGQAAFSSPDWVFLKEKSWVIWRVLGFSVLWIAVMSSVILAISSCFARKGLALMTTFGLVFLVDGITQVASQITGNVNYGLFSLRRNLEAIAEWLFHEQTLVGAMLKGPQDSVPTGPWNIEGSFWALGIMVLIAFAILWTRVKRLEVIA